MAGDFGTHERAGRAPTIERAVALRTSCRRCAPALLIAVLSVALAISGPTPALAVPYVASAWGENTYGQLGDGTMIGSDVPVPVSALSGVASVSGGGSHSAALLSDGTVVGWGGNIFGQLGNGTHTKSDVPVAVSSLSGVTAISAGAFHDLALREDGSVMSWGENEQGQLGDGSIGKGTGSAVPVAVSGLSDVSAVSAYADDSMALLGDATVEAWGLNNFGQLGDGSHVNRDVPVAVAGLSGVSSVSAGRGFSLALLGGGTVMAWGRNVAGQLGDGNTIDSSTPVPVATLGGVVAVSAGGGHSLALLEDGTVVAWGANEYGQLGDGTTVGSDVPVAVSGLSGVSAVAAGDRFSLALLRDGTVLAWGRNNFGQLGDGTIADSHVPTAVERLTGVVGIAADGNHGLAFGSSPEYVQAPAITRVQPRSGPVGGGVAVTITGSGFTGATAVSFGSVAAASFEVQSASTITAVTPAETAGVVDVSVTTPAATTIAAPSDHIAFTPTVDGLEPTAGPPAGGTKVTVTGTGFALGETKTRLEFGATRGSHVKCPTTTTCTVLTPAEPAGKVTVKAIVNGQTSPRAPADVFTYG